jgi:UDP-glucose 4-epimerase
VRALVTGGAGFIGSHVVEALLARGDEVHVLDNLATGRRENVSAAAPLHEGDIRSDAASVFDSVRPEACFHLAAQADVRVSVAQPDFDADVNVVGTIRVLEAARAHGTKLVFSSTGGAIYGECEGPAPEDSPRRPLAPYGTAKLAAEEYLETYNRLYGTSHAVVRYANVYGPRQEANLEGGVVSIFMRELAEGGTPRIFGDGKQTRDFVYVGDVAAATLRALDADGGVFNIGTGIETSVVDLYDAVRRVAGLDRDAVFADPRPGEIHRSVLDVSRAERELGWRHKHDLHAGLTETWAWIRGASLP